MTAGENSIVLDDSNNICIQLQSRENHTITHIDDKTNRSSPSFNSDSEPPTYFEALRIPHPMQLQQAEEDSKDTSFNFNQPAVFNHQRHHYIRTQHLPASIYSNNQNRMNINLPSETYLVWSIFTTVYCVFIGIIALILSIQIYHYNKQENYQKAFHRSKICRNVNIAGLFIGIIYLSIGIVACLLPR